MFELPHLVMQATHAQMLLLKFWWESWSYSTGSGVTPSVSEPLISEVFRTPGGKSASVAPTVEGVCTECGAEGVSEGHGLVFLWNSGSYKSGGQDVRWR
ncbi:intermembrane lipid transfer protein VPS13B-like [Brachyhypopomus gauderio]|uniref:intermembrane lipid transfer protein VPS13B-like n=1 Tax=Brachyhypopomus gauderio TaxID=698409 RepID=UPI004043902F